MDVDSDVSECDGDGEICRADGGCGGWMICDGEMHECESCGEHVLCPEAA